MPRILNHVTVVRDGRHNAFTSLVHWQGAYRVAYRKGGSHMEGGGEIAISESGDRSHWREAVRMKIGGSVDDNRDPWFVVVNDRRLALLIPNVPRPPVSGEETALVEQWITFTQDGSRWDPPRRILPPRQHLFRVREHEGLYYGLSCYREGKLRRLELWTSADLLEWSRLCQVGDDALGVNESDIVFRPDGEAWIVSRTEGQSRQSLFSSARPPYTAWRVEPLGLRIMAPCILEHAGKVYLAGRAVPKLLGEATWPFGQSLFIWELTRGQVRAVLRIPTGGDSTYPGFIHDADGRLCLSYYSQHAYCFGVLPPFDARVAEEPQFARMADIFFAEIELP